MKKYGIVLLAVAVLAAYSTDYSQFEKPLNKDQEILHALNRLTFGPRPGDVEAVRKMGVKKWVDQQLHPERIAENSELAERLKPLDSLRMSPEQIAAEYPPPQLIRAMSQGLLPLPKDPEARARVELQTQRLRAKQEAKGDVKDKQGKGGDPLQQAMRQQVLATSDPVERRKLVADRTPQQVLPYDLNEAKLYRAIYGNRQLEEQMADFWFNHFNVYMDKGADRILIATYERDAIRPHVFSKFRDLLEATAESPAMLFYLDNWQSVSPDRIPERRFAKQKAKQARGLNENYARELMELHTLGVDGGYTQKDIVEVARCFTGWTISQPNRGGEFIYNDRVHDKGEKIVLGVKIPAGGGKEDAEKVLDILSRHPSTARFISTKLAKKFVADDPPPMLLDRMAKTFHDTDGDIRAVMSAMLDSKEFFSEGAFRAKVKTPLELIVSAVRATDAQVDFAIPLATQIAKLGEPLYRKIEPTGYPSANSEWVNSAALLARMNFALALADNRVPGSKVDANTFENSVTNVARQLLFHEPARQTLDSIEKALAQREPTPALIAGLVLGSPDFQRR
ncbi:MAG: DUF1800 domain-containing protein [Acidobacteriia bacterium]|nr:DUF1800 domain-containing protein [Terriglobia bacterium]